MIGRTLMVQGTCSSAGKSLLTAALCRIFARRGVRVAPFKAQNMSNNAAVCADGCEIGRAQALQALAAGLAPTVDMNPILLKPEADSRSQVIVNGRAWQTLGARRYFQVRQELWPVVTGALDRLRAQYELVVIEGAGSPAEPNLRDAEIVNMAVARYARSPVVLVGDIERGGVFAQLLGTLWLLTDDERALIRGLIVNKFRGDRSLFDEGVTFLEKQGGVPVLGVVPWLIGLGLPEEDAVALDTPRQPYDASHRRLDIAVIRLPHIANFDDFDRLASDSRVALRYVDSWERLGRPHAIILPGTKSTVADLEWLRAAGLADAIVELARRHVAVVGICGGYQMLGLTISDPHGIESAAGTTAGLGLLSTNTHFEPVKETHQVAASIESDRHCPGCIGQSISGYEIHMGRTTGDSPWLKIVQRGEFEVALLDGSVSADGRIWGCYLHGLFANDGFRQGWLDSLEDQIGSATGTTGDQSVVPSADNSADWIDGGLDRLADGVEAALDLQQLEYIIGLSAGVELCPTK